jgi:hypothetical protein
VSDSKAVVSEIVSPASEDAQTPDLQDQSPVHEQGEPQNQIKDNEFSSRFAALSRKEKFLRDQQNELKSQSEEVKALKDLQAKIKENPLSVLEQYNISMDDLIAASLGDQTPEPTVENQVEALRKQIEDDKAARQKEIEDAKLKEEEEYQNSIDEAITAHKLKIDSHLSENASKYELINLQGAQDLVWEVTEAYFDANDGEVLTPEQAADKVEVYLEQQIQKALELERFNKKPSTDEQKSAFAVEQLNTAIQNKSHTLTSENVQAASPSDRQVSSDIEESKRRAAALLKWD